MKASKHNKVLGLAIGEKAIVVAEVASAGDKPEARRLGEFTYPANVSLADPATLGAALGEYLREQKISAKSAVVGLPAKWLLVKTKEVPPADSSVAADLLRLQAEGDFSSELKDLVFDYAGEADPSAARNVLLIATPQKYIDLARQLCEGAKLEVIAITSSSAALGTVTGQASGENAVVLTLAAAGAELTAQSGGHTSTLRHLRAPSPEPLFLSELRRAVSMLPANGSSAAGLREIIVWDGAGLQTTSLGESIGMRVRSGDLPSLGVSTTEAARNGGGRKFAAAVALGVAGLGGCPLPIDFLHSRLAAPAKRLIARWMIWTAVGVIAAIAIGIYAYTDLQKKQQVLDSMTASYRQKEPDVKAADAFVTKVSFAQGWHGGDPRYLACMNEITRLVPEDGQTYCTSLNMREKEVVKVDSKKDAAPKTSDTRHLVVSFFAKAPNQAAALQLKDAFQTDKSRFIDVHFNGTQNTGKGNEVTFSFTCTYVPAEKPLP